MIEETKEKLIEKSKENKIYNDNLIEIKKHYGIDFELNYLEDEQIKTIRFSNLKYKNIFTNATLTYDNSTNKFNNIMYEFTNEKLINDLNHREMISDLSKQYKLDIVVKEINKINFIYRDKLEQIESKYLKMKDNISQKSHQLQIVKNTEN